MPSSTNKKTGVTVSASEAVTAVLGVDWVAEDSQPSDKPTPRKPRRTKDK